MESAVGMLPTTAEKLKLALSNIQRHNKDTFGLYQAEASASQNLVDVDLHQNRISVLRICLDGDFSTQLLISWYDKQISQRTAHSAKCEWFVSCQTSSQTLILAFSTAISMCHRTKRIQRLIHSWKQQQGCWTLAWSLITRVEGKNHMLIKALADSRSLHSYPCESRFSCPRSFGEHSPIFHKGPFCAIRNQRGAICYKCGIEAAEIVWNDYCQMSKHSPDNNKNVMQCPHLSLLHFKCIPTINCFRLMFVKHSCHFEIPMFRAMLHPTTEPERAPDSLKPCPHAETHIPTRFRHSAQLCKSEISLKIKSMSQCPSVSRILSIGKSQTGVFARIWFWSCFQQQKKAACMKERSERSEWGNLLVGLTGHCLHVFQGYGSLFERL